MERTLTAEEVRNLCQGEWTPDVEAQVQTLVSECSTESLRATYQRILIERRATGTEIRGVSAINRELVRREEVKKAQSLVFRLQCWFRDFKYRLES